EPARGTDAGRCGQLNQATLAGRRAPPSLRDYRGGAGGADLLHRGGTRMARSIHDRQPRRARSTTPGGQVAVILVGLALVVSCTLAVAQERRPESPAAPAPQRQSGAGGCPAAEDPGTVLADARTRLPAGPPLPDAVLRPAVAAALHPDAPWPCA